MQDKIQEIMGLVNKVQKNRVCAEMSPSNKDHFNSLAEDAFDTIQSKLRELVREPLSEESKKLLVKEWSLSSESFGSDFLDGISYAERAHKITNASGVE